MTLREAEQDQPGSAQSETPLFFEQRDRLRAERAERLTRLRPAGRPTAADAEALEDFLGTLRGVLHAPLPVRAGAPAEILRFARAPEAAEADCDLDRLPGMGPGLRAALGRAGIRRLADLVRLDGAELAARLGPIGRLVPAERWIETARGADSACA